MKLSKLIFTGFALVATVSSTAIARAWDGKDGHAPRHGCLTDADAAKLVAVFENFFVSFEEATARKYLAPGFQEVRPPSSALLQAHLVAHRFPIRSIKSHPARTSQ